MLRWRLSRLVRTVSCIAWITPHLNLAAARAPEIGELVVCDDVQDPLTLDPQKQFSEKNHIIVQQIFDGLVRFGSEGEIEPALAVSWQRTGPMTLRFQLRENVQFHNGEPFTAESVKFSIERYLNPATGFPALGFIASIRSVDIVDPLTVDINTTVPDGLLLHRLASFIVMVPPIYVRDRGEDILQSAPIGTGPFVFVSWKKGEEIVLASNTGYWDSGFPKADGLRFRFIPMEKQVKALLDGKINILTSLPGTRTLEVQRGHSTFVMKKPSFFTVTAAFNINTGPLANKRIRQALNMAINKEDLIRYDLLGNGRPIATLSFPDEFGHDSKLMPYPYDPTAAKRILKEEGYPDGFRLRVFLKVNAQRTEQVLKTQLARIGVMLDPVVVTDAELFKYLQDKSQWDVLVADCPDIMHHSYFMFMIFFYSRSPFCLSNNPFFDARLDDMSRTIDLDQQRLKAEALDRYVWEEALAIFTYQRVRTYGLAKDVDFVPYKSGMHHFFRTGWKK